ncbi:MAG: hypothetical protein JSW59_13005 [Phycisphaerales bacterium]|nr:MAG: hypothetical protein JSW59_13005 [Phycisphaerales bacterium]
MTEQRASDRQVLQDLWEMVLNNTRAKAALAPAERQAIEQARDAEVEETTSP